VPWSEEETKKEFMRNAVSFVLSEYPRDVDIMDIPTLVEYVDKRILVWEPFVRRSGIELSDIIDQLFEMNYSTYLQATGGGAPESSDHTEW
jgi:hypothetical protein